MGLRTGEDWRTAVAAIEAGVGGLLAGLDRFDVPDPAPREIAVAAVPVSVHDDRLEAAGRAAAAVEAALAEQEADWLRWRDMLTAWRHAGDISHEQVRSHPAGGG